MVGDSLFADTAIIRESENRHYDECMGDIEYYIPVNVEKYAGKDVYYANAAKVYRRYQEELMAAVIRA